MKRRYITISFWLAILSVQGQDSASSYRKKKLALTDIQVLFASYLQDGIHSAVTGGKGTENLQVYAPDFVLNGKRDSTWQFSVDLGVDVVTSASTDNIDYVISSASRVDYRGHSRLSANRLWNNRGISLGASGGLSIESDYFSRQVGMRFSKTNSTQSRTFSVDVQAYLDDLRWGRVNPGYFRPVKLIYPSELRGQQWLVNTKRNSLNVNLSLNQVLNRRTKLEISAGFVLQEGLLSTPFHRVYFADTAWLRVEKLPSNRLKIPVGLQVKRFAGQRLILKFESNAYWDSFGILAQSFQAEVAVKLSPMLTISAFGRWYGQRASRYFKPFGEHLATQQFYTSDYDLAQIQSVKLGMGLRYAPFKALGQSVSWKAVDFRYAWYRRSDTLHAHIITLLIDFGLGK